LSGKDSMYVDGHLPGRYGERHKVSALESLQFSAVSVIPDIRRCVTPDPKAAGDRVYVIGNTADELGASEYYDLLGYIGNRAPKVQAEPFMRCYRALTKAIERELVASAHGIYRGGLGVHLALTAMAGNFGLTAELSAVPSEQPLRSDRLLFSESAGRFIVTIDPRHRDPFEKLFDGLPAACIGHVTDAPHLSIVDATGSGIVQLTVSELKTAWQTPFGELI
ncbi:MAG: phosphoribosylformylglycinamidine synthase, partial [Desulfatitalea sp.]|nr:phosphoribosylformylglycinamidine synthase [Desulfatitalea sp.]NNJ99573.1 phosphoribosylformylglycinamidine synthase [Desulfatitalea sp.]